MTEIRKILLNDNFENVLEVGQVANFFRDVNPSTGYSWNVIPDNSGVYEIMEVTDYSPSVKATGVPAMKEWSFKIVGKGKGAVKFNLLPPGASEISEEIIVKFDVK